MKRTSHGKRAHIGLVAAAVAALAASFIAYAVTASNTVPTSSAGSGAAAISGYTVTNVSYTLNATTPTDIDAVSFTISPTNANTVRMQLVDGGSWYSCTNAAGSVSCTTTSPQATVGPADQLTVVAVD